MINKGRIVQKSLKYLLLGYVPEAPMRPIIRIRWIKTPTVYVPENKHTAGSKVIWLIVLSVITTRMNICDFNIKMDPLSNLQCNRLSFIAWSLLNYFLNTSRMIIIYLLFTQNSFWIVGLDSKVLGNKKIYKLCISTFFA